MMFPLNKKTIIRKNNSWYRGCSKPNQSNRKIENRINPNRNCKKPYLVRCIWIAFLLNWMVWFSLRFSFYQPNQTKPNCNIVKTLIKSISLRPILIETQWKLLWNDIFFLLLSFFFVFYFKNVFMCYLNF